MKQLHHPTSSSAFRVHSITKLVLIITAIALLGINARVINSGQINGGFWTAHGFPFWALETGPMRSGGASPHTEPGWITFETAARAFCINTPGLVKDVLLAAIVLVAAGAVTELFARHRSSIHTQQATLIS